MRRILYAKIGTIIIFFIILTGCGNNKNPDKELTNDSVNDLGNDFVNDLVNDSDNDLVNDLDKEKYTASFDVGYNNYHIIPKPAEFNAYEYSQNIRALFNRTGFIFDYGYYPFGLSALVVFSKDELRLLREKLENDLQRGFEPGVLSEAHLTSAYNHNINIITTVEKYFPNENETNSQLSGLWRLAYGIPDQGYWRGDYLKIYGNGIFEYVSRNFQATRHRNQIYGGSKFGLWTTDIENNHDNEYGIDILIIQENNEPVEKTYFNNGYEADRIISVFNDTWMRVGDDVNVELDWGT